MVREPHPTSTREATTSENPSINNHNQTSEKCAETSYTTDANSERSATGCTSQDCHTWHKDTQDVANGSQHTPARKAIPASSTTTRTAGRRRRRYSRNTTWTLRSTMPQHKADPPARLMWLNRADTPFEEDEVAKPQPRLVKCAGK